MSENEWKKNKLEKRQFRMQKVWDFLWKKENDEKEEENVITESFIRHVRAERRFKMTAAFAFLVVVFGFGWPMWLFTTSIYRAPFPVFPKNRTITIPVRIVLATTSEEMKNELREIGEEVVNNLILKESVSPLKLDFSFELSGVQAFEELEKDHRMEIEKNDEFLKIHIAIVPSDEWNHYSATMVRLGIGKWNFVQWPKNDVDEKMLEMITKLKKKASTRIIELIWEILIDVPHLNTIVRRDLRQKMQGWQIAALPLSHQKRLVWDSAPLALNYQIQLIHLHENEAPENNGKELKLKTEQRTAEALRRMAKMVKNVTKIKVTSEHFWDFEVRQNFLKRDVQERWTLSHSSMEQLIKTVDAQTQTTLETEAVLRFVIIETDEPVIILDQYDEDSNGIAVAAWGAILARNDKTESRAIAALRVQIGMDAELMPGWWRPPVPICHWEIVRARLRASIDNAMRASSAIRGLDEMTQKISNIAINDEVAQRARRAVELLEEGIKKGAMIDFDKLLEARQLADSAISDHSLLSRLYFPLDQRTAVLCPIVVPVVFPVLKLLFTLIKKTIFRSFM